MAGSRSRSIPLLLSLAALGVQAQDHDSEPPASSSSAQHFAAGSVAFERQDYRAALAEFLAAIEAGSEGPAARYNAAVCYYRLGEYREAEMAFRALGEAFPDMAPLADYNLGLALVRQDEFEPARRAFEAATEAEDERIAALAGAMLARLPAEAPAASRRVRLLDFVLGYDDNVALIDPLALPGGQGADSSFGEFLFYGEAPLTDRWQLAGNALLLQYTDADDFDQSVFDLAARYAQRVGRWSVAVGPRFGRSYIGGDGFEQTLGGAIEFRRPLESLAASLEIDVSFDEADELEPEFAYIAGDRAVLALRLSRALDRGRLAVDARVERHDRAGPGVSADRRRYRLSWGRPLARAWQGDVQLEYRDTRYDRLSPVREEKRHQLGLRASRELDSAWRLSIRYTYGDNDSSDPRYAYTRHRVAAGITRWF